MIFTEHFNSRTTALIDENIDIVRYLVLVQMWKETNMRVRFVYYTLEIKLISGLVHSPISNYKPRAFTP